MRFYDIVVSSSQATAPTPVTLQTALGQSVARWQSYPGGVFDPQALDVEFDIYVAPLATPMGNSWIRVWGIDLATLRTSVQFSGNLGKTFVPPMWLTVKGGMGPGLPLNQPKQAGLLAAGLAWQSFGNWQGTEMSLDLVLNAGGASWSRPVNIIFNWAKNQALSTALKNCLATAFPGTQVNISISQNLVATSTQVHVSHTLVGLGQYVSSLTQQMQGSGALGVQIVPQQGGITVTDGTVTAPQAKVIDFTDLIGQPTWQEPYTLWVQTVLRGDILVGDTIQLPKELASLGPYVLTQAQSLPAYRNQSAIQGQFFVKAARHTGHFRVADGAQWASTFFCVPLVNGVLQ